MAEGAGVIQHAEPVAGGLLVVTTHSAAARITRHSPDGAVVGEIALPELCSVVGLDAGADRSLAFVQLEGFTRPASLFRWTGGELEPHGEHDHDDVLEAQFAVTQERYPSADGTEIGLFLVHRADEPPDVDTPCILTGYGGFAIAETPAWSPTIAAWAEAGGLFAVAGLRGGYEEGESWHQAGRRQHKQRVFDDFHAAADHLVTSQRTSRDRLAIRGGSNGGLLVGVAMTQRPDLCRAVHCAVPLLDMVRYPQFLIARLWKDEYGDPDVAEELDWLLAYSPYHHVKDGVCYPAVLMTTAESDSRVDPLHARKMAAALQAASSCPHDHPILLQQESRAGHGAGQAAAQAGRRAGRRAVVLHLAAGRRGRDVTRLAELVVSAEPQAWRDAGFTVDADGVSQVGLVRLRLDPAGGDGGLRSWALAAAPDAGMTEVDGLPTGHGAPPSMPAPAGGHPIGASAIDHLVVATPDLARTIAAIETGLGLPLLRTRDADSPGAPMRQAFFRMGEVVLEVVGRAEADPGGGPARFYGVAITVEDLDAAVERPGDRIGRVKPAVQRGRSIATFRTEAGLGVPVALMSPAPARGSRRALTGWREFAAGGGRASVGPFGVAALTTRRRPPPPAGPARPGPRRRSSAASTTGRSGRAGGRADGRRDRARPSWSRRRSSAGRPSAAGPR